MTEKNLCEICNPKQWKTVSSDRLIDNGYPVYGANGVIGYYSDYNHEHPTLLITCRGATCGALNICEPFSYVNGNAMALDSLSNEVDIQYLYYYLLARGLSDVITGSAQPQIVRQSLTKVIIKYPSLGEQHQIITVLDKINRLIVQRNQQLEKLDLLIKSKFIEMFGDFTYNNICWKEYRLQELLDLGWITYHLDGNHGGDYPRNEEFVESGVSYISANCIVGGRVDFTKAKYVTEERAKRFRKGIAQNRDVLFAHNATVGPVAILETREPIVILGTSLTAYRCNTDQLMPEYLKTYLECEYFVRQYEVEMQQSTRKQVPITTQRKYTVVVPTITLQKEYAVFFKQNDKIKLLLKQSLEKLTTLKNSLMQKYFG